MNTKPDIPFEEIPQKRDAQIYPDWQEMKILGNYCCANCWGLLSSKVISRDKVLIYCEECGEGTGFHSKYYRDQENEIERREAREAYNNCWEILGLPEPKKQTVEEILKDLGF